MDSRTRTVAKAEGKLGIMCVGLGAVASTFIAGVELARQPREAVWVPLQLATIRLGKRTDERAPLMPAISPVPPRAARRSGVRRVDPVPDDAYWSCSDRRVRQARACRADPRIP